MTHPEHPVLQQHRASVVFGLGLSSLIINVVGCCANQFVPFVLTVLAVVLGILGWVFGRHDLRAMEAGLMDRSLNHQVGQNPRHGVRPSVHCGVRTSDPDCSGAHRCHCWSGGSRGSLRPIRSSCSRLRLG